MFLIPNRKAAEQGFTLIEVLVTMIIIMVGLLGVLGLQTKATSTEFESYQRGQALGLAREMATRLFTARGDIVDYVTDPLVSSTNGSVSIGDGDDPLDCDGLTGARANLCQWGQLLQGSAASEGDRSVGAMIGARGCLIRVTPAEGNALADIYVVVVWQGIVQGSEPAADSPAAKCASGVNFGTGLRRGLSMRVLVPNLQKDSAAGGPVYTE